METLSLLIMNWRDPLNPEAGGAEVYTHEIAKRLVEWGNEVTLVTSRFDHGAADEWLDGVRIRRAGDRFTVYRRARDLYLREYRGTTDAVIDEINTIPFMTPKYVNGGTALYAVIHQIARESWSYEVPFPIDLIGRFLLEGRWLRLYHNIPTLTVSPSAKAALVAAGFQDVNIVPNGISVRPLSDLPPKEEQPTILFVGRLKRVKLPDHALHAFARLQERLPEARLWVVGEGYLRKHLERRAPRNTVFFGRVSEEEKLDLMRRAHVLLYPAVREGWGLSVTEANAMGTPAVGYNVPGLCDSIRHGETGMLVPPGDVAAMATSAEELITHPEVYRKMALNALRWAGGFAWSASAAKMRELLSNHPLRA